DRRECPGEGRQDRDLASGARTAMGDDEDASLLLARLLLAPAGRLLLRSRQADPVLLRQPRRDLVFDLVSATAGSGRDRRRDRGLRPGGQPSRPLAARAPAPLRVAEQLAADGDG